jgi:tripartite-type tricarboxylate transporter receptor subunit TctC
MSPFLTVLRKAWLGKAWPRKAAALALAAGFATAPAVPPVAAQAQVWPQRNVRFILPFGAGSATDIAARLFGEKLAAKWGKAVIVENRPGGDGLVAINAFISANDDHVLLYASSASFMAHPYTQEKLPYVLERDLAPIAQISDTVVAAGVPAATGITSVKDFVTRARAEPTKFNVAGAAGVPEFAVTAFLKTENLGATKVPYRDVVQAGRDLAENRIQFLLSSYAVVRPHIEAGKVKLIAVGGRTRSKVAPDVPSVVETGYKALITETTSGLYGPKDMPLALRERIGADVIEAMSDATVSSRIAATGQDIRLGGPAVLAATLKQQADAVAGVAKILGMERKK